MLSPLSLSSQAFELATGDYLFEPHSGEDYSRDEGIVPSTLTPLCQSTKYPFSLFLLHWIKVNKRCFL